MTVILWDPMIQYVRSMGASVHVSPEWRDGTAVGVSQASTISRTLDVHVSIFLQMEFINIAVLQSCMI